jgi:hypothetical protein
LVFFSLSTRPQDEPCANYCDAEDDERDTERRHGVNAKTLIRF